MENNLDKIVIARLARRAVELYAKRHEVFDSDTLGGACAIASFALKELFEDYGYNAEVYNSDYSSIKIGFCYHCFVESDKEYWDITATQFDKRIEKVRVSDKLLKGIKNIKIASRYDMEVDWPPCQRPVSNVVNVIKNNFYCLKNKYCKEL